MVVRWVKSRYVHSKWRFWEPLDRAEHAVRVDAGLMAPFRFYAGVLYAPIYPCGATGFCEHDCWRVALHKQSFNYKLHIDSNAD